MDFKKADLEIHHNFDVQEKGYNNSLEDLTLDLHSALKS